jgi:nucleoside-diphosphate-sugar epimerase
LENVADGLYTNGAEPMKVLVAGASGLVGCAVVSCFLEKGWQVVGVSRRSPAGVDAATFIPVDLREPSACEALFSRMRDLTHVVYAALHEQPGLVAGWNDAEQRRINLAMFRNLFDPIAATADGLRHVTLLQGMKAYGVHLGETPVPVRERAPRHAHENFYWLQEDHLRQLQAGRPWFWSILRPHVIFGQAQGGAMNLIAALGVYGALQRERDEPLYLPQGARWVLQAVDADLLAQACYWCATSERCGGEIFNIHNGEPFEWASVWPTVAEALGLQPGPPRPVLFNEQISRWQPEWEEIVNKYHLLAPRRLSDFVGLSFQYADRVFGTGSTGPRPPALASTVKARQAGFHACMDTEEMFRKWFARYRALRWLPPLL